MIAVIVIFLCLHLSTSNACVNDNECGVFQTCVGGMCVANNQGCNPPCVPPQVCIAPTCVAPPPVSTTTAPGAATTTTLLHANRTTTFQREISPTIPDGSYCCSCSNEPLEGPRTCPPNWTPFNNNCYIASLPGRFLFNQASDWCTQTGSRVVWFDQSVVTNFGNELNFINSFGISRGVSRYWIGVNKQFGQWVWTNGSPVIFSNWRPSQPDGCCGSNVTCVFVNYANFFGQWDDAPCGQLFTDPQGFICKRPL
ncbi:Collectin-12, partial [Toxocara canis]